MADRSEEPGVGSEPKAAGKSETSPEAAGASPAGSPPAKSMSKVLPTSVSDRLTIYVARAIFFLAAIGLGIQGSRVFSTLVSDYTIPVTSGMVVAGIVAIILIIFEAIFVRGPVRTIAGVMVGLMMGLVLSLIFQPLVTVITKAVVDPGLGTDELEALISFLNLMTTCIFCYFGVTLVVTTKDELKFIIPYVQFRKEIKGHLPLILDTSAFIDGRIQGLLAAGIFDQRLEVPKFVLDELQHIADSSDRSLRERGRRGLDILNEVDKHHQVEIVDFPLEPGEEVDFGLLRLTMTHEGKLLTTDHNLTKRARVQGVGVVNINDLATAMKPAFVPGQVLRVRLQRPGDDPGQAVGFLNDGTMVVVEEAFDNVGHEVSIQVTSALQTSAGKMIFGKLARAEK